MWKATWALLFGASLMLTGCGETTEPGGPGATNGDTEEETVVTDEGNTFTLTVEDAEMTQGAGDEVEVTIDREEEFDQPVEVTISGLPQGVTATKPTQMIEKGAESVTFVLSAAADAAVGDAKAKIVGKPTTGEPVNEDITVTVDAKEE